MKSIVKETVDGRELLVFLPESYASSERAYPVAYVHDGGYLFQGCMAYLQHLNRTGRLPEIIYVGVTTSNRNLEYTPWPAERLVSYRPGFGGQSAAYIEDLAERIKPFIDSRYRTIPDAGHTGTVGASFGGLVSMHAAVLRPDVFGLIGSLSGSYWFEGYLDFLRRRDQAPPIHKLYMYVGEAEGIYKDTVQKDMVANTRSVFELMRDRGLGEHALKFVTEPDGTHDDLFFVKRFPKAMRWMFAGL